MHRRFSAADLAPRALLEQPALSIVDAGPGAKFARHAPTPLDAWRYVLRSEPATPLWYQSSCYSLSFTINRNPSQALTGTKPALTTSIVLSVSRRLKPTSSANYLGEAPPNNERLDESGTAKANMGMADSNPPSI